MPIEVAEHAGFCMGVAYAVNVCAGRTRASLHGGGVFPGAINPQCAGGAAPGAKGYSHGKIWKRLGWRLIIRSHGVYAILQRAQTIAGVVDCTCRL